MVFVYIKHDIAKKKDKTGLVGIYRTIQNWLNGLSFSRGAIKLNFTAVLFNNVVLSTNFIK